MTTLLRLAAIGMVSATAGASTGAEPSSAGSDDYRALFTGKDLKGWEGVRSVWKVEEDMIVGETKGLKNNEFLATTRSFGDFDLKLRFRLRDGKGNSGIQFRSERIPNHHEMIGYQADIGQDYWGCLYDESRRRKVLVRPPEKLAKVLKKTGWNDYRIRCVGPRVEMFLNGLKVVDYVEPDPEIPRTGKVALQVHSAKHPIRVEFKDIRIRELDRKPSARKK